MMNEFKYAEFLDAVKEGYDKVYPLGTSYLGVPQYSLVQWWEDNRDKYKEKKEEAPVVTKPILSDDMFSNVFYVPSMKRFFGFTAGLPIQTRYLYEKLDYNGKWISATSGDTQFHSEKAAVTHIANLWGGSHKPAIWKAYNAMLDAKKRKEAEKKLECDLKDATPQLLNNLFNETLTQATVKVFNRTYTFVYDKHDDGREKIIMSGRHNYDFDNREFYYGEALCSEEDTFSFIEGCTVTLMKQYYYNYTKKQWILSAWTHDMARSFLDKVFMTLDGEFIFNIYGVDVVVKNGKVVKQ